VGLGEFLSCLLVSDVLLDFYSTSRAVIEGGGGVAGSCCGPLLDPWWRMVVASRFCGRGRLAVSS
jgi:hypothetical protein